MVQWLKRLLALLVVAVFASLAIIASVETRPASPNRDAPRLSDVLASTQAVPRPVVSLPSDAEPCSLPEVPLKMPVVLISVVAGLGVSSVTIGSQDDFVTTAVLNVEPGAGELYVLALSEKPVIWRVTGAVERVHRLVVGERKLRHNELNHRGVTSAGVVGLSADKVFFLPHHDCLPSNDYDNTAVAKAGAELISAASGRLPNVTIVTRQISAIRIPSGAVTAEYSNSTWREAFLSKTEGLFRLFRMPSSNPNEYDQLDWHAKVEAPEGVITIGANEVISEVHVEPYLVPPGYRGLQQLAKLGILEDRGWDQYFVKAPMRFPAGMNRGSFVLKRGVPMPSGDPGRSCIYVEGSRQQLAPNCM